MRIKFRANFFFVKSKNLDLEKELGVEFKESTNYWGFTFSCDEERNVIGLSLSIRDRQDIQFLKNFTKLKTLFLKETKVQDYSPIGSLTQLERLFLGWNQIQDPYFLTKLQRLKALDLSRSTEIKDFSFFEQIPQLETLYFNSNHHLKDFSFLRSLVFLKKLELNYSLYVLF